MRATVRDECQLRTYKANRLDGKGNETNSELPEEMQGLLDKELVTSCLNPMSAADKHEDSISFERPKRFWTPELAARIKSAGSVGRQIIHRTTWTAVYLKVRPCQYIPNMLLRPSQRGETWIYYRQVVSITTRIVLYTGMPYIS